MNWIRSVVGAVVLSVSVGACSIDAPSELVQCDTTSAANFVLTAQAVPSATLLPCVRGYPPGWRYGGSEIRSGIARFWLDSDRAGIHAVEISLTASCSIAGTTDVTRASRELDVEVYARRISITPFAADRYFVFDGGCVTYRYRFAKTPEGPNLAFEVEDALTFVDRSVLVGVALDELGVTLCGADAPPCVGED